MGDEGILHNGRPEMATKELHPLKTMGDPSGLVEEKEAAENAELARQERLARAYKILDEIVQTSCMIVRSEGSRRKLEIKLDMLLAGIGVTHG